MKRVLIIGSGGSGKTTLARELAARTGLPLVHLDQLYWRAGWQPTPAEEWRSRVEALIRMDSWVMDGNYGGTLDMRLEACDTVVFLDLPRLTCLWRVLRRQIAHRGRARADMPAGCPERLTWDFVKWIWTYPRTRRGRLLDRLAAVASRKRVVMLHSAADVARFVNSLPAVT